MSLSERKSIARVDAELPRPAETTPRDKYSVSDERRRFPARAELFKPAYWFPWSLGLIECWAFSRRYGRLFAGLPFLLAVTGGIGFLWWLRHASDTPVLMSYENGVNEAIRDGDAVRQENYLTALVTLRPREPQYRFRLGMFLVNSGRPEGVSHILQLAPEHADGYAEARLWLVEQARSANPILPMTDAQIESQLLRILRQRPQDADTHHRLAQLYVRKSEYSLAEDHLQQAARTRPELYVELAQLKRALSRPADDIQKLAAAGVKVLSERLAADRGNVELRIALAQAQLLMDQPTQSRETLVAGIVHQDDPRLRRAVSDFDLLMVDQKLASSVLNRDACVHLIAQAIRMDPSNVNVVRGLARLQAIGAEPAMAQLQPAIDHWRTQATEASDADKDQAIRMLSQLYAFAGDYDEAVEQLASVIDGHPELRIEYARMLRKAGRTAASDELLEELLAENPVAPDGGAKQVAEMQMRAELLLLADRPQEAREFLQTALSELPEDHADRASLELLVGRACLMMYDARIPPEPPGYVLESTPEVTDEQLLEWLIEAAQAGPTYPFAIDRMARLTFSNHSASRLAESTLTRLRATQDPNGLIANLTGMHGLQAEDYERARRFLEMAYAQSEARNGMILNNLAVALIRGKPQDLSRALDLVNKALELSGDNADLLATRAEIYVARKQWNEAYGDLSRALVQRPKSRDVHLLLEQVHLALDDPELAAEHARIAESLSGS